MKTKPIPSWRVWFAWRPVYLEDLHCCVWLERVAVRHRGLGCLWSYFSLGYDRKNHDRTHGEPN